MDLTVRPARADDAAVPALLYLSAAPYYDAFAGDRERALALLEATYAAPRHAASHDVCHVVELDGEVIGVMAAFPARDGDALARRLLRMCFARIAPWRWPRTYRHLRAASTISPTPPPDSFYVDALAVAEGARRRGVARALLAAAENLARAGRCKSVALDTGVENAEAQRTYEACGFERRGESLARDARTERIVGGRGFVTYVRPI